eukprot:g45810.t1
MASQACNKCQKTGKMLVCGSCQSASYCSAECQKADWKVHKKPCKKIKAEKQAQALKEATFTLPTSVQSGGPTQTAKIAKLQAQPQTNGTTSEQSKKDVIIPASVSKGDNWYLKESKGKGMGLFAARDLQPGDLVLEDAYLLTLPMAAAKGTALTGLYISQVISSLDMAVQGLPDAARRIVYALYDCAQPPSKDKPAGPPEEKGMTEEKERLLGIARNAFPLGYEAQIYGLFPVAARLNHSCRPNVHHSFDEVKDRLVVYAVTQIKKDQELFTSYYDLCLPRAA